MLAIPPTQRRTSIAFKPPPNGTATWKASYSRQTEHAASKATRSRGKFPNPQGSCDKSKQRLKEAAVASYATERGAR